MAIAKTDKPLGGPDAITFVKHCAGRFEIELPKQMLLIESTYGQPQFYLRIYPVNDFNNRIGLITGENRLNEWLAHVEEQRLKEAEFSPTTYVTKHLKAPIKIATFYKDIRGLMNNTDAKHLFYTFLFKDFPEHQVGLAIEARADKFISRDEPNVQSILQQRIDWVEQAVEKVEYQTWPHRQVGVCLPRNILIANPHPLKKKDGSYRESYGMKFSNSEGSDFKIKVNVYGKGTESRLKERMDRVSGMMKFFASKKMTVAGRKGRILISRGKYSETQREFLWMSTDTKINSVHNAHITISGEIESKNFPELAPLNATYIITGLLKGVRVRENGLLGIID